MCTKFFTLASIFSTLQIKEGMVYSIYKQKEREKKSITKKIKKLLTNSKSYVIINYKIKKGSKGNEKNLNKKK